VGRIGGPGPGYGLGAPSPPSIFLGRQPSGWARLPLFLVGPTSTAPRLGRQHGWAKMASKDNFFSSEFFLFSGIKKKEIRKTVQKIQNYIFSVIENFRDIYGLFFIPLRTLVLLFIFYAIFPVNYETNVD
jgi:hypothetical protein